MLYRAVTLDDRFGLDYPRLTGEQTDMKGKADWWFPHKLDPVSKLRPAGRIFAGSRFLSDTRFTGQYLVISAKQDSRGVDEYSVWHAGARGTYGGGSLPEYLFYLTAWTDGPDGEVLQWCVVDMADWASRPHVVFEEPAISIKLDGAIPCNKITPSHGRPFYRFPISALMVYEEAF